MDLSTRSHLTVEFCHSTTPAIVMEQFPELESLKVKGLGDNGLFQPLPKKGESYATPWITHVGKFTRLHSLCFKKMIVTDADLEMLAGLKSTSLKCLQLVDCSGFSTKGLETLVQACRNLETFSLRRSEVDTHTPAEDSDNWFHIMATTNAHCLKTLDLDAVWSTEDYASLNIRYKDIKALVKKCEVETLVLQHIDPLDVLSLLCMAKNLTAFQGGSKVDNKVPIAAEEKWLPPLLCKVGLYCLGPHDSMVYAVIGHRLTSLDATQPTLFGAEIAEMFEFCPNLEKLRVHKGIGDDGLISLSKNCKKLVTLVLVDLDRVSLLTEKGLIALAGGCSMLEKLSVVADHITSQALKSIGRLVRLRYFKLVMVYKTRLTPRTLDLNAGLKSLLIGCKNLSRLDLHLGRNTLNDEGLSYLGEYGNELIRLLLGYVGGTSKGLLALAQGCPKLQTLSMRGDRGYYGWSELFKVVRKPSLECIWLQGFFDSLSKDEFLAMVKDQCKLDEGMHAEIFFATSPLPMNPLGVARDHEWYKALYGDDAIDDSKLEASHHLIAYKSVSTEARCDYDDSNSCAVHIYPPPKNYPASEVD